MAPPRPEPKPKPAAVLPERVELVRVRVPAFQTPAPLEAVLPERFELEIARTPELKKAPPLPEELLAPDTVTSEIDRSPPKAMLKTLKTPRLPLMLRLLAPRPVMFTVPAVPPETEVFAATILGNAPARVMV